MVLPGLAVMLMEGVRIGFTVIVIEFDVAVVVARQLAFEVSTQEIASPFVNDDDV